MTLILPPSGNLPLRFRPHQTILAFAHGIPPRCASITPTGQPSAPIAALRVSRRSLLSPKPWPLGLRHVWEQGRKGYR
ncbi:MAG: hypothetical protein ABF979_14620 [Gluconobacter sp.]|uniref:hypothetical protein n=1 Tax=Gluconobacter sp. TaxID=1876758 RepID=UPI0039E7B389